MQDTCLPQNYVNCIKVKVCGCRRFRKSVLYGQCLFCSSPCLPLSIFSLSGFPALFHRKSCHVSPFPPFAFCYPFLRCSSLRYRPSVFRSLFYALLFFHIIMYAHVCVEMLQVLQVCKFAFRFSVFSCFPSAVFVWVPSFFRPYTRVRIL